MSKIRPYQLNDYSQVKTILKEAELFDSVWDSEMNLKEMINKNPMNILVVSEKGEIIACVYLIPFGTKIVNLFRLTVRKKYRNQGIATTLIDYVEKFLKSKGVIEMGLYVNADNQTLEQFYKKRQFTASGNKYIYMWKELK